MTLRDLMPGDYFKLFTKYRDGARRPRFKHRAASTVLHEATASLAGKTRAGVIEITPAMFDFNGLLTVKSHKRTCTVVSDQAGRIAPMDSDMLLRPARKP